MGTELGQYEKRIHSISNGAGDCVKSAAYQKEEGVGLADRLKAVSRNTCEKEKLSPSRIAEELDQTRKEIKKFEGSFNIVTDCHSYKKILDSENLEMYNALRSFYIRNKMRIHKLYGDNAKESNYLEESAVR